ncbi:unnamed protein product, partial [Mesorhabditis belari]|uniref:Uncharacterized protein n=1 Tax=Mesorhabditis belari TaxID=2138241 RepID=A0AAF3EE79_9BILA
MFLIKINLFWLIFGSSLRQFPPIRPPKSPPPPLKRSCQSDSCSGAEWCAVTGSSIICIKLKPCNHLEDCPAKYSCQYDYNTLWKFCYPIGEAKGCPTGACPLKLQCGVLREQMVYVPK